MMRIFCLMAVGLALVATSVQAGPLRLAAPGPDRARGVLVNLTVGFERGNPPAPGRPTVVVAHGLNPFHPLLHLTLAERYAEAINARYRGGVNIVGWDWNADTLQGLSAEANARGAIGQGQRLAGALLASGVEPAGLQLVGHSTGCVVVTSASRALTNVGRPPGRLTLIDPAGVEHRVLFEQLGAATSATQVEHAWMPGPSGVGKPAAASVGLHETRLQPKSGLLGFVFPGRADHFNAVRWHIGEMSR
jgi:hypothetical protein